MLLYHLCRETLAYNQAEHHSHPAAKASGVHIRFIPEKHCAAAMKSWIPYAAHRLGKEQACVRQWALHHCFFAPGRVEAMKVNNRDRDRDDLFINERIRDREVRVISAEGEQLGIMSSRDALKLAEEAGLDLVKISPNAKPPVCKIIDYGKYKYEKTRKEKDAKRKQHIVEIKEIRLSPNIDTNDLTTKVNAARKFLTKGNRVKITLRFRGREMAHMSSSAHILSDFANQLTDCAVVEKAPRVEGRSMTMFLAEKR